jgi:hypothetical protein
MTAAARHKFNVDDLVTLDDPRFPGIVWKVTKQPQGARGVNYVLANVTNPGARGARMPEDLMRPYTGTESDAARPTATLIPLPPPVGTVVLVRHRQFHPDALHVVTGDKGDGVRLVRLGADGGRYYPNIPTTLITVVPVAEVAQRMPAHLAAIAG